MFFSTCQLNGKNLRNISYYSHFRSPIYVCWHNLLFFVCIYMRNISWARCSNIIDIRFIKCQYLSLVSRKECYRSFLLCQSYKYTFCRTYIFAEINKMICFMQKERVFLFLSFRPTSGNWTWITVIKITRERALLSARLLAGHIQLLTYKHQWPRWAISKKIYILPMEVPPWSLKNLEPH